MGLLRSYTASVSYTHDDTCSGQARPWQICYVNGRFRIEGRPFEATVHLSCGYTAIQADILLPAAGAILAIWHAIDRQLLLLQWGSAWHRLTDS